MKTKEELNALKEKVETMNKRLAELSEDELEQVAGGVINVKDREDISGGMSGSGGHFVVDGGDSHGPGAGEMHFPNNENGLEPPIDPANRLGF